MKTAILLLCAAAALHAATVLENRGLRIEVQPDASARLTDKTTGRVWSMNPPAVLREKRAVDGRPAAAPQRQGDRILFSAEPGLSFELRILDNPPAVEYSYRGGSGSEEVWLLNRSLAVDPGDQSYYAVPHRLGNLLYAEGDQPVSRRMRAYTRAGYSMAMFGVVNQGSAILATWEDPYTDVIVDYSVAPRRQLTSSIVLSHSARSFRLQPLGRGGYVEIAKAYRAVAKKRGLLKTLAEKMREEPATERLFGAADFKPFVFFRRLPNTRFNRSDKEIAQVFFTFEEAAQLAAHFKNDLGIDRAMLVLAGWINGGYDVRHPDILPAAPELGGDEALAECSRRVRALGGWSFGLHDNYQDMYKDAPSWNESYVMRNQDGSLKKGGVWNGGQAYLICSRREIELASRPQNVPAVRQKFAPDVYFVDTVFAANPQECFDPQHPLTRADDLRYKQQFCDYFRKQIGLFGSEEGGEWGVPHADYFEGLLSHKTGYNSRNDPQWESADIIVPLFELVYGDCIPIYTHQSDRPRPDNPAYILDHILYAEMPVYLFGTHRYWTDPSQDFQPPPGSEPRLVFARGGEFDLYDQFIKNTYEVLSPLNRLTALMPMTDHKFLTPDRKVEQTRFGRDVEITVNFGEQSFSTLHADLPAVGLPDRKPQAGRLLRHPLRRHQIPRANPAANSKVAYPINKLRRIPFSSGAAYPIRQNWSSANSTTDSSCFPAASLASFCHGLIGSLMPIR